MSANFIEAFLKTKDISYCKQAINHIHEMKLKRELLKKSKKELIEIKGITEDCLRYARQSDDSEKEKSYFEDYRCAIIQVGVKEKLIKELTKELKRS